MFFAIAIAFIVGAIWIASRGNESDRAQYDSEGDNLRLLVLHVRQDLKLISYLLIAIIAMLGVVAERLN